MRRFELVEGKSSKFWEVSVEGETLTVSFGRIGTAGQTKTKTFTDHAAALNEESRLIKEKTGKGYAEVTTSIAQSQTVAPALSAAVTSGQTVAMAQASAAPVQKQTTASQNHRKPAEKKRVEAETVAVADSIAWPDGGFDWDEAWESALPVMRGVWVPPFKASLAQISNIPQTDHDPYGLTTRYWTALAQAGAKLQGQPWSNAEIRENLQRDRLMRKDEVWWQQVYYQCIVKCERRTGGYVYGWGNFLSWVLEVVIALHGVGFALKIFLSCGEALNLQDFIMKWHHDKSAQNFLRHAIAAAESGVWQECVEIAQEYRGQSAMQDCVISYLFPENTAWAVECLRHGLPYDQGWWLQYCALPAEDWCALVHKNSELYWTYIRDAVALQLRLHNAKALPVLALMLDGIKTRDKLADVVACVLRLKTPAMPEVLVARFEQKEVKLALEKLLQQWPAATLFTAVQLAAKSRSRVLESWVLQLAIRLPEVATLVQAQLPQNEQTWFGGILAQCRSVVTAAPEAIPQWLREPPWLKQERPKALPVLALTPLAWEERLIWQEGEQQDWLGRHADHQVVSDPKEVIRLLSRLGILPAARHKIAQGKPLDMDDLMKDRYIYRSPAILPNLPEALAVAVWNFIPGNEWWSSWDITGPGQNLLARYGLAVLPGILSIIKTYPEQGLEIAMPCDSMAIVPHAARIFKNTRKAYVVAKQWLLRHPEAAITALIPEAFGKNRKAAENAWHALRFLSQSGFTDTLKHISGQYGKEAAEAVAQLLATDPLQIVPLKMPALPAFFVPAAYHPPELRGGGALPAEFAGYIGNMLTISTLEDPYTGLQLLREICTTDSLAEFSWDIFEAWQAAGAPSKEKWAFTVLGLLGNDETARRLTPLIRQWPGESQHARAVTGLDILAMIGSDVALMHLNGIAEKLKFKGLQNKAREKISEIAEQRGLTAVELADRLVPDLGLDDSGSVTLDFGPRRFYVSFDESLKPFVKDSQNVRLKDLPKPGNKDDAALSSQAVAAWKALKKDAKAVAGLQLIRMEQIMCNRRRWDWQEFKTFFIDHPLMRHLSRRVVWGVYRNDVPTDAFRVAEDLTLADRHDESCPPPEDARIGIVHVLELPPDMAADFGQIFADYEILQPFKQLGRETYSLTDEEASANCITRFKDKVVATGSIMGLINRGWERGEAQDAGWVGWFTRRLPDGSHIELVLDPGTVVGDMSYEPEQHIPEIVRKRGWDKVLPLTQVDPVMISEVLRDADLLPAIR